MVSEIQRVWLGCDWGYIQSCSYVHFSEVSLTFIIITFEVMVSYFCNSSYKAIFVSFAVSVLLSSTCLWICKLLDINTEVSGIGHELLWILHDVDG